MPKKLAKAFNCPTEFSLAILGGKWKTVILCYLKQRPLRFAELRTLMPKLSEKVMTERLQELVAAGLIERRKARGGAQAQHYLLTATGESLRPILGHLYQWGMKHAESFGVTVDQPLKRLDS